MDFASESFNNKQFDKELISEAIAQHLVWQYSRATKYVLSILFAIGLQFQPTNNAEQLNKQ